MQRNGTRRWSLMFFVGVWAEIVGGAGAGHKLRVLNGLEVALVFEGVCLPQVCARGGWGRDVPIVWW